MILSLVLSRSSSTPYNLRTSSVRWPDARLRDPTTPSHAEAGFNGSRIEQAPSGLETRTPAHGSSQILCYLMTHVDTRHVGASHDAPVLDNPSRAMFSEAIVAADGAYQDKDTAKSGIDARRNARGIAQMRARNDEGALVDEVAGITQDQRPASIKVGYPAPVLQPLRIAATQGSEHASPGQRGELLDRDVHHGGALAIE
ncbi:hypothetical protein F4803DRAFT_552810 [Xylaria telfairii]|nr:hypothetical protein F4803DRAFT_552810 [Xylaria telfairii]